MLHAQMGPALRLLPRWCGREGVGGGLAFCRDWEAGGANRPPRCDVTVNGERAGVHVSMCGPEELGLGDGAEEGRLRQAGPELA